MLLKKKKKKKNESITLDAVGLFFANKKIIEAGFHQSAIDDHRAVYILYEIKHAGNLDVFFI